MLWNLLVGEQYHLFNKVCSENKQELVQWEVRRKKTRRDEYER